LGVDDMKGFNMKGIFKSLGFLLSLTILSINLIGCGLTTDSSSENSQIGSLDLESMSSATQDTTIQESTIPEELGKKVTIDLYFPDKGNEAVLMEKHELEVYDGAVLRAAVEGLLAGPESGDLVKSIPEGTKLLGINLKNDLAIVDFSKEFTSDNDVADDIEKVSLVNTLTEFEGINKVKILIEGYDWIAANGEPYGEMTKIALDSEGKPMEE
jgi:germination protein M